MLEQVVDNEVVTKKEYCKNQALERLGETRVNTLGSKMWIIDYTNSHEVEIQFEDGYLNKTTYNNFCNGSVRNPNDASVFGYGYIGIGKFQAYIDRTPTYEYSTWKSMLRRCYDYKFQKKFPTYKGCSVAEEWLNFQTFAKWYTENFYQIDNETMTLDKDILVKGNKVYGSDTCVFVPSSINLLFTKRINKRGLYPIGVYYNKPAKKFIAQCRINDGNQKNLGCYTTPKKAFDAYKEFKESFIKEVADKYKNKLPKKLYDAMYSYEVEIDD